MWDLSEPDQELLVDALTLQEDVNANDDAAISDDDATADDDDQVLMRTYRTKRQANLTFVIEPSSKQLKPDAGASLHKMTNLRDRKSTRLNSSHLGISYAV